MKTWTVRLGLSLMVVVGLWTSRAPAQEYVGPPGEVYVVPTVPFVPNYHVADTAPLPFPPGPPPSTSPLVRTLNFFGMACESDSFGTTGSFQSEFRWMFGSSRNWFGDRCCPCGQPCADRKNP